jgi:hypothetical protein
MTKLFKLVSFAAILGIGVAEVASADPLAVIGNNFTQNRIGTSVSDQSLNTIVGSTVANGSAGNTLSVVEAKSGDGFATFIGNNFLQQEIGNTYANQTGVNIINSSVANNAAGNAITFSGQ